MMAAQAEAYARKKPKRIIQNQVLICLIGMFLGVGCLGFGGFVFWLIFGVAPAIVVPSILIVWAVGSLSYIICRFETHIRFKRHLKEIAQ